MATKPPALDQPLDLPSLCLAITERAPLPMATVEGSTHIVRYGNPAFCRMTGKALEQLVGKPLEVLLPAKDACLELVERVFRTKKPESYVEQDPSNPHPVFWAYTIWPVVADEGLVGIMIQVTETAEVHGKTIAMNEALMLGSLRQHELTEAAEHINEKLHAEIAERQKVEEALRQVQAQLADRAGQLEQAVAERTAELTSTNQHLEAFAYSIAHDLRAPLRSMQSFSKLLVDEEGANLSKRGRDFARRVDASAQFMDALLTDLLVFSRSAREHIQLIPVDLKTVIQSALKRLDTEILETHARVSTTVACPAVLAHEPILGQVLVNLISNAMKFIRPNVPPQVLIRAEEQGRFVRVWVEDNGIGIAPEHQKQLFQIFQLFTRLHGEKYPGTGFGLAIVQNGIQRMGGQVGVESTLGKGSRFWFELPKA